MKEIKAGDMASFETLVNKYKDYAFTLANRVLNNSDDAEEVAHDSFLKVLKSIDQFKEESKFTTWFYRIVVNMAISRTRKKKLDTSDIDAYSTLNVADASSADDGVNRQDRSYYIEQAIGLLKEDERILVTLYYFDELSMAEVQEITGYELSNLKVKLFRVRKKMAENLQKVLPSEIDSIMS
ncbi:MAG: RNA polymerase sigma factor [Reichenbachiella sp.]